MLMRKIRTPIGAFMVNYDGYVAVTDERSDGWVSPVIVRVVNPVPGRLRLLSSFLAGWCLMMVVAIKEFDTRVLSDLDYAPRDLVISVETKPKFANTIHHYIDNLSSVVVYDPPIDFIPEMPSYVGREVILPDRRFSYGDKFLEFIGRFNGIYVRYTGDLRGLATAYDLSSDFPIVFDDRSVERLRETLGVNDIQRIPPEMELTIDLEGGSASLGGVSTKLREVWDIRKAYMLLVSLLPQLP